MEITKKSSTKFELKPYSPRVKFELKYGLYIINSNKPLIFSSVGLKLASVYKLPISTLHLLVTAADI